MSRKPRDMGHPAVGFFTREEEMHHAYHSQFNTDRSYPGRRTIIFSNPPISVVHLASIPPS